MQLSFKKLFLSIIEHSTYAEVYSHWPEMVVV